MNNPDFFPDLRLATLEKYAASWAGFMESLGVFAQSITLHFPPQQYFRGKKYLVLFRIKEIADPAKNDRYVPDAIKLCRGPDAKWTQFDVLSRAAAFLGEPFMQGTLFHGFEEVYDTPPPEGFLKRDWAFRFNTNPMLGQDYPWVADLDGEHAWSLWAVETDAESKQGHPFPCAEGTRWEDVTFTLKSDELVVVKTPSGEARVTYHELGFTDKRKGDQPNKTTWALFCAFAKLSGEISPSSNYSDRQLSDRARNLNKHLQTVFGIADSIYAGHYKPVRAYRTRFKITDERYNT